MESVTAMTSATIAALTRDYYLWIAIFSLILAFGLYVYFVPSSFEFFDNQKKDNRVRSEPPIQLPAPTPVAGPVAVPAATPDHSQQEQHEQPHESHQQQQQQPIDLSQELAPA